MSGRAEKFPPSEHEHRSEVNDCVILERELIEFDEIEQCVNIAGVRVQVHAVDLLQIQQLLNQLRSEK